MEIINWIVLCYSVISQVTRYCNVNSLSYTAWSTLLFLQHGHLFFYIIGYPMTVVCLYRACIKLLRILNTDNGTLELCLLCKKIIKCRWRTPFFTLLHVRCSKATGQKHGNARLLPRNLAFVLQSIGLSLSFAQLKMSNGFGCFWCNFLFTWHVIPVTYCQQ